MKLKLLKVALALLLPAMALSFRAGTVEASCPCENDPLPPETKTVSVDISPQGAGDVEVDRQLPESYPVSHTEEVGEIVRLVALPADGYYFVGWSGDLTGNETLVYLKMNADQEITAHFFPEEIVSEDNRLHLVFPVGTVVRDEYGEPLDGLEIAIGESLSPPPEASFVGQPYELGPDGTTFDQSVSLSFSYDPAQIPEGITEEELYMAYYDEGSGLWLELPSVVDVTAHVVTALVDHLSAFAVIAPDPPSLPAAFTVGSLNLSPLETEIGQAVAVSVLVTNSGQAEGSYSVALTINGEAIETRELTMAGGSQTVSFSFTGDEAGSYAVDVNGLEGSFTVLEAPLLPIGLPKAVVWTILGLAMAALVVATIIFPIFLMRRGDHY